MKQFWVYILSNKSRTLYIGITSGLQQRVYQHRSKQTKGFTSRYNVSELVYFEEFSDAYSAIRREKQLKGWLRKKKIALIESMNPDWKDLAAGWFDE